MIAFNYRSRWLLSWVSRSPRTIGAVALILCLIAAAYTARVSAAGEFLLFPQVDIIHRSGLAPGSGLDKNAAEPALDLFYTTDYGRLRLLTEVFVSEEEQAIERFQVGWLVRPETTLWLGRFHNPLGYWHSQYHHGDYLQTSISDPGIAAFDHDGGPLPSHLTGLLLEGQRGMARAGLRYTLAAGMGPQLDEGLEPVDILQPAKGDHKLVTTVRISYRPDADGPNEIGVFTGHNRIPTVGLKFEEVRQTVAGVFVNWQSRRTRLIGAAFHVRNKLRDRAGPSTVGTFNNAYLQVERQWSEEWILYSRLEGGSGTDDDPYLQRFTRFVAQGSMAGLRYDFSPRQAIKLELARNRHSSVRRRHDALGLQWSMVFP